MIGKINNFYIKNRYLKKIFKILRQRKQVYYIFLYKNMAKRKNKTQIYLKTNKTTKIIKDIKNITKIQSYSTSNLLKSNNIRNFTIAKNIYRILHQLSNQSKQTNNKRLMSVLNIPSQDQIICSAMDIPSIQNMLASKKSLADYDYIQQNYSQSGVSFLQSMSYCIIESEPQLMLSYICLLQRTIKKLGITLSSKQNEKLIMGVWNILIKFWMDDSEQNQYQNINTKIEWGLLQLLNFDLRVSKKQRILIQGKICSLSYLQD